MYLLKEGMFYQYNLKRHQASNVTELLDYARKGYQHSSANRGQIPEAVAFFSKLRKMLITEMGDMSLLSIALMRDQATGLIYWKGIIVLYILPLLTVMGLIVIKCRRKAPMVEAIES